MDSVDLFEWSPPTDDSGLMVRRVSLGESVSMMTFSWIFSGLSKLKDLNDFLRQVSPPLTFYIFSFCYFSYRGTHAFAY